MIKCNICAYAADTCTHFEFKSKRCPCNLRGLWAQVAPMTPMEGGDHPLCRLAIPSGARKPGKNMIFNTYIPMIWTATQHQYPKMMIYINSPRPLQFEPGGVRGRESGEQLAPFETLVTAQPEKQGAVVRETESIEGMEGDQVEHGQDEVAERKPERAWKRRAQGGVTHKDENHGENERSGKQSIYLQKMSLVFKCFNIFKRRQLGLRTRMTCWSKRFSSWNRKGINSLDLLFRRHGLDMKALLLFATT